MTCDQDIIVGIDFGTTASGIAFLIPPYSRAGNISKNIAIFQSWKGPHINNDLVKAPTVLAYSQESPSLPIPAWGNLAQAQHMDAVSWFKLLLDKRLDIEKWIGEDQGWADSRGILSVPEGMTALRVVSDFLSCLRDTLWQELEVLVNRSGGNLDMKTIQFWFTVPVSWSDSTRGLMREAISNAGFDTRDRDQVHLLTEPQAAMTFALSQVSSFTTGDGVIICDCGGGTVVSLPSLQVEAFEQPSSNYRVQDLASYQISHKNPLIFDELAHSNGASP
ncbi:hypothetical protein F1880_000651 [Penicillium rolfsii]|nr:hypothetical protein F1880_000651 [Penicillium rolfsii]